MIADVVIAGGGLAGAAAAADLARAGKNVTLIERETGPTHKICGEFLSSEAQASLARIGFDVGSLGGHKITALDLACGAGIITTKLPFEGLGITRYALDEALLAHAAGCGATVLRGRNISKVVAAREISLELTNQPAMDARTLFLATGKHEVRGLRRDASPPDDLVGYKMYFQLSNPAQAALAGKIALILFKDGYAGLQMVEHDQANLCLLTSRARVQKTAGKWPALLADLCLDSPYLARILPGATELLDQPLTIYRVPYGYIHHPLAADHPDIFRLGDQAGVIPSFTGDGMAIALHSAARAASMFLAGETAAAYHQRLSHDITSQIHRAGWLYRAASAPLSQGVLFKLMQAWPASLQLAARLTRVPPRARLHH
ncbi:MAG: hypothetical protein B7Z75_01095 [Acidocella sp. 20-57-95]|nr:MAG: hypothetical protein B7Z75_01095 [Acidocella sp. 20-57-95]OYV58602.1 MAG: hypothetical protein B7Z71_09820 [Acidocella sp. 21-58-7]HQT65268.1 FAD-dependent oxidoreductase [Acidocella sp.]HQU05132.1 FAD-dependent oxidoreductase [Acidocella sp.]